MASKERWRTRDHNDEEVILYEHQWPHIAVHKEFVGHENVIKSTLFDPNYVVTTRHTPRYPGGVRRSSCKLGAHPRFKGLYVVVAVEYGATGTNFVVTAFLPPKPPDGEVEIVWLP